jgi:hypothetical protein
MVCREEPPYDEAPVTTQTVQKTTREDIPAVMQEHRPPTGQDLVEEEPASPNGAELRHWIGIYERLIEFTEEMLDRTWQRMSDLPSPAQRHLQSTNVRIMEEELAVFKERLARLRARGGSG